MNLARNIKLYRIKLLIMYNDRDVDDYDDYDGDGDGDDGDGGNIK